MDTTKLENDNDFYNWLAGQEKKVRKKYYSKGLPIYVLHQRVNNTAYAIVQELMTVPFEELTVSLYVFCKDSDFADFSREYEAVIEYAKVQPDKFVDQLYSFYDKQAKKIKEKDYLLRFLSFLSFFYFRSIRRNGKSNHVICAYLYLLTEQTEFLKTDKFCYNMILAGIETDGTIISVPDIFPNSDLPTYGHDLDMVSKMEDFSMITKAYREYGYKIESLNDMEALNSSARIYQNTTMIMASYINEFNTDILPQNPLDSCYLRYHWPELRHGPKDIFVLQNVLMRRKRTLPANGITVTFSNSTGFEKILLKETFHNGAVIMLYRMISDRIGDVSGFYNTKEGLFFTPFDYSMEPEPHSSIIKILVMGAYAAFVCNDQQFRPTKESYLEYFRDRNDVEVSFSADPGKLKRTWNPEVQIGRKTGKQSENCEVQITSVAGYVRKLPVTQTASATARELAAAIGLELEPNETYVQPFFRQAWVLKDKMDTNRQ